MLIRDWMSKNPVTVTPDTSMMKAAKLMKEKSVRRLPVVDDKGEIVGIVTDHDVKEASPSKATTLEVHELYYLLSEIKVKDIMTKNPICISPTETVERAALVMNEKRIGGLPVIDGNRHVVGIVTDMDIFRVLISITGVRHGGVQFGLDLSMEPGSLKVVVDDLKSNNARIVSILSNQNEAEAGRREVYIRILPMSREAEDRLIEGIKSRHRVVFWARDNVHALQP